MPVLGTIIVIVLDDQGLAKPNVPVGILSSDRIISQSGTTGPDGKVTFSGLRTDPETSYNVTVQSQQCCTVTLSESSPQKCVCATAGSIATTCSECSCT